jgi:hypothetical protein
MPKDALAQAATAPAVVEKKEDDTPVLEQPKTWKALGISIVINILQILAFAIIMGNFIYFKTLNKDQLAKFFPTFSNSPTQAGGGILNCEDYPRNLNAWDDDEYNNWLGAEHTGLWEPLIPTLTAWGDKERAQQKWFKIIPGIGFQSWIKLTISRSYNILRGWLKSYLQTGFVKEHPSIWNNMFFQSFLFILLLILFGVAPIVTLVQAIIADPWYGIIFLFIPITWVLVFCITVAQGVQMIGTFMGGLPLPGIAYFADAKLTGFKTIRKIWECNIPTLIFLFSLNMVLSFGGIAGGGVAIGMWVWFIYATYRKTKSS